jgi:hypothetical protein
MKSPYFKPNIFTPPIEPFEESIWKGPPKYSKYSAKFLGSLITSLEAKISSKARR